MRDVTELLKLIDAGKMIPVSDQELDAMIERERYDVVSSFRPCSDDYPYLAFAPFDATWITVDHAGNVWKELPGSETIKVFPEHSIPGRTPQHVRELARACYHTLKAPKVLSEVLDDGKRVILDIVREEVNDNL
jgi:hypothetical protein